MVRDIRPHLTRHKMVAGCIVANDRAGGMHKVVYRTRFGEKRELPHLNYVQACIECNKLRSRGYNARVKKG